MLDCDVIVLIDYKGGVQSPPPIKGNDCWDYIFCLMDLMRFG